MNNGMELEAAARFIGLRLRKWGRIHVSQYKEKYGTVRVYCYLGWYSFHGITHPGHAYRRYPKWLWLVALKTGSLVRMWNWLVVPYQEWLYRRIYEQAVKRWPHLRREILADADWYELLKGL